MTVENAQNAVDALELQEQTTKNGLADILEELQGISVDVVEGVDGSVTAATQTLTGITTSDTLIAVIGIDGDNATLASTVVDHTSEVSITDANEITLDGSDASGEMLVVFWFDKE